MSKETSSYSLYGGLSPKTWYFLRSVETKGVGKDILITTNPKHPDGIYLGAFLTDSEGNIVPAYQTMTKNGRVTAWSPGGLG